MYIFGGYTGSGWLRDLVVLDTLSYKWLYPKVLGDAPSGREGHSMCSQHEFLYIYGGWDGGTIGEVYRINTLTFVWEKLEISGDKPLLCGHSMTLVDDSLFIFGGFDGMNWMNALYRLDLLDKHCEKVETRGEPIPRGYHTATLVNRYILIYAGYNGKYILGDLVALDTENMAWSMPDPCLGHFPNARNAHTMTMLGSELFMFGGYNGTRDTDDMHILETAAFSTLQDDFRIGKELGGAGRTVEIGCREARFRVHEVVIRARCPKLMEIHERNKGSGGSSISIETRRAVLEIFVEYLYCDVSSEKIGFDVCHELKLLALQFEIDRLRDICIQKESDSDIEIIDSSLTTDIMSIRNYLDLSDFVIVIENTEFFLHKVVLGCRCPYFRAMFQSGMSETTDNRLFLDYFTVSAFEFIVDWIYSDKFSPLFGETKLEIDIFVQILMQSNMLGLEGLMRMAEIAAEELLTAENVVKLYEVAHALGAVRLKSYTINFILREIDMISIKRQLMDVNDTAFEELNTYLPRKIKRQTSKKGVYPILNQVRFDKSSLVQGNIEVKAHAPKSGRLPSRDLKGILSLRNPLNIGNVKSGMNCASPQPKKFVRRQHRTYTHECRPVKDMEPPDFMVQGISPRYNSTVERRSTLRHAGMQISSSLTALYQNNFNELNYGTRFMLYK